VSGDQVRPKLVSDGSTGIQIAPRGRYLQPERQSMVGLTRSYRTEKKAQASGCCIQRAGRGAT
jgi:hypothetical protein